MLLRYFYNEQLAHASYLVGCQATGEAILVDPGRDIEPYLREVESQGLDITAVAETHIHADFVSGARELAERTGARLYLSDEGNEDWKYLYLDEYEHTLLTDGDIFKIGNIEFEAMHTPGHTPEHLSFLVTDTATADQPMGIFTGDFIFVGDVGRPDLLEKAAKIAGTAETGARQMFHSVQRFKQLPDYLQVWPAHGAGSACGKALGAVPTSTVGYEKLFSPLLAITGEETFIEELLAGQPEPPRYFAVMKRVNKEGPAIMGGLPRPKHLPFNRLKELLQQEATLVDTRSGLAFASTHIPGSINIPYGGDFTTWAGWLLDYEEPFYLLTDSSQAQDVARQLIHIGLDNIAGYFETHLIEAWLDAGEPLQCYQVKAAPELAQPILNEDVTVVDVRSESERAEVRIPNSQHIMLGYLPERVDEIPTDKPVVVHCSSGFRSGIAASVLQAHGIRHVINMMGGLQEWLAADLPVERNGKERS